MFWPHTPLFLPSFVQHQQLAELQTCHKHPFSYSKAHLHGPLTPHIVQSALICSSLCLTDWFEVLLKLSATATYIGSRAVCQIAFSSFNWVSCLCFPFLQIRWGKACFAPVLYVGGKYGATVDKALEHLWLCKYDIFFTALKGENGINVKQVKAGKPCSKQTFTFPWKQKPIRLLCFTAMLFNQATKRPSFLLSIVPF